MTDTPNPWSELEKLLLDPKLLETDAEKNPKVLRCPCCPKAFRFEDQVLAHVYSKHHKDLLHQYLLLKRELEEVKEAMIAYRALARERH
jgi:uncharacterized C2H2 Zn-finger protein